MRLDGNYLFSEITRKVNTYKASHPDARLIRLGIGDVSLPLAESCIQAMHQAVDEMAQADTFRGYGPEQGYDFLTNTIDPKRIPVNTDETPVVNYPLQIKDKIWNITCVSMGNPHAVIFVDDTGRFPVAELGPYFESHPFFPNKTNVEFIQVVDKENINMRVWERGAGETLACGTGACAAAVAAILNGHCGHSVSVALLGGTLAIEWDANTRHVYMTGEAVTVFEGTVNI